jgi:hypothetical protein
MSERVRERALPFRGWAWVSGAQARLWAIVLAAAIFMALAAPFGTSAQPLVERLGFWVVGTIGGILAGKALDARLGGFERVRLGWLVKAAVLIVVVTPPMAVVASAAAAAIHRQPIDWAFCLKTMPPIAFVGAGFAGLLTLARHVRDAAPAKAQAETDPGLDGLLPARLVGARLLALEAQDHYVRVYTDRGAELVLIGFEMALKKVSALDGRRVHRSWWAARTAVQGVRRGGGRAVLTLAGGVQAPVSRRYARRLRSEGWY